VKSVKQGAGKRSEWTLSRKILVAFLALACTATAVIAPPLFWELHEANKALRSFSDALIAKRYGSAYDFASKEFRATVEFSTFQKTHNELTARMGDLKSVEITHSEVKDKQDGWYGTAETSMDFSRGNLSFLFDLKKEGNSWKIYSYHEE